MAQAQTSTKQSFQDLINSDTPVLVDFYADWCGPCRMMPPILDKVKKAFGEELSIVKIDVDQNQQAAAAYQVRSIPTLILFQNGKVLWQQAGVPQASQLESVIREHTA